MDMNVEKIFIDNKSGFVAARGSFLYGELSIKFELWNKKDGGVFLRLPKQSYKKDGEYVDFPFVVPKTKEVFAKINKMVLEAYEAELKGNKKPAHTKKMDKPAPKKAEERPAEEPITDEDIPF